MEAIPRTLARTGDVRRAVAWSNGGERSSACEADPRKKRAPALRLLTDPLADPEPAPKRMLYVAVAAVVIGCFVYVTQSFWAPAHPGVDQNGYLVGGKMLAQRFSPGMKPAEPYAFVGAMWVRTRDGWYYPKYPIGLPLLNAAALWLDPNDGDPNGKLWAMLVSPVCTTLALAGMFLLVRLVAGSFLAVAGMILLATSMTTLAVANSPWSHGPALCFVTWGAYLLVRWWQTGAAWRGALAGLLLGYAVTIRYTEGLLVLPLAGVVLSSVRWRQPTTYLRASIPAFAWLVPVVALVAFNKLAMRTWTGYDSTNESTGFTMKNFLDKWEFMAQQLYDHGLFFVAPLGVLGLAMMYRAGWRVALFFTLWFVPGVLIYTAYYWGLQRGGVGYLRFFLTLFPPVIVGACWLMRQASTVHCHLAPGHDRGFAPTPGHDRGLSGNTTGGAIAAPIASGIIVAIAASIGVRNALPALAREHATNVNLADTTDQIRSCAPPGSVVFIQQTGGPVHQMMNFLQFAGDYDLYAADAFSRGRFGGRDRVRGPGGDGEQPHPLQPARQKFLSDVVYKDKSDADLVNEQNRVMRDALARGRRVFAVVPAGGQRAFVARFMRGDEFTTSSVRWWEELAASPADAPPTPFQPQARGGLGPGRERGGPQAWQVIEITRAPAAQPAAPPAAPPAAQALKRPATRTGG